MLCDQIRYPKQAQSAYLLFLGDKREEIKATLAETNPDYKPSDVMKEGGRLWNQAEGEEKALYERKAEEAKAEFKAAVAKFHEEHPDSASEEEAVVKAPKKPKGPAKDPNAPSKPLSSYMYFTQVRMLIVLFTTLPEF